MNLTVYVPDALHKRLEEHRDQINVSALVQQALEKRIDALETPLNLSEEGFEQAVQRLVAEKEEMEQRFRDLGVSDGLKWALASPYADLAEFARKLDYSRKTVGVRGRWAVNALKKIDEISWSRFEKAKQEVSAIELEAYGLGAVEGISQVWNRIREVTSNGKTG